MGLPAPLTLTILLSPFFLFLPHLLLITPSPLSFFFSSSTPPPTSPCKWPLMGRVAEWRPLTIQTPEWHWMWTRASTGTSLPTSPIPMIRSSTLEPIYSGRGGALGTAYHCYSMTCILSSVAPGLLTPNLALAPSTLKELWGLHNYMWGGKRGKEVRAWVGRGELWVLAEPTTEISQVHGYIPSCI